MIVRQGRIDEDIGRAHEQPQLGPVHIGPDRQSVAAAGLVAPGGEGQGVRQPRAQGAPELRPARTGFVRGAGSAVGGEKRHPRSGRDAERGPGARARGKLGEGGPGHAIVDDARRVLRQHIARQPRQPVRGRDDHRRECPKELQRLGLPRAGVGKAARAVGRAGGEMRAIQRIGATACEDRGVVQGQKRGLGRRDPRQSAQQGRPVRAGVQMRARFSRPAGEQTGEVPGRRGAEERRRGTVASHGERLGVGLGHLAGKGGGVPGGDLRREQQPGHTHGPAPVRQCGVVQHASAVCHSSGSSRSCLSAQRI